MAERWRRAVVARLCERAFRPALEFDLTAGLADCRAHCRAAPRVGVKILLTSNLSGRGRALPKPRALVRFRPGHPRQPSRNPHNQAGFGRVAQAEAALRELRAIAGSQFEPAVVEALTRIVDRVWSSGEQPDSGGQPDLNSALRAADVEASLVMRAQTRRLCGSATVVGHLRKPLAWDRIGGPALPRDDRKRTAERERDPCALDDPDVVAERRRVCACLCDRLPEVCAGQARQAVPCRIKPVPLDRGTGVAGSYVIKSPVGLAVGAVTCSAHQSRGPRRDRSGVAHASYSRLCAASFPPECERIVVVNDGTGYGRNVNIGLRLASGDFCAVVNNDCRLAAGDIYDLCVPETVTSPLIIAERQGYGESHRAQWLPRLLLGGAASGS
jgi:hypothetical protein